MPEEKVSQKLAIDRPCSACSSGDTKMEYHDHHPPFRAAADAGPRQPDKCKDCGKPIDWVDEGHFVHRKYDLNCLAVTQGRWPVPQEAAPRRNLQTAEAKLAENGIAWEEGKGYVFDGKE